MVLTKADKLSKAQRQARLDAFVGEIPLGDVVTMVPVSSENGEGIDRLKEIIAEIIGEE